MGSEYVMVNGAPGVLLPVAGPALMPSMDGDGSAADAVDADAEGGPQRVVAVAQPGDHILCMSNGGFGGVHAKLLEALVKAGA